MLHPFMAYGVYLILNLRSFLMYALFQPPAIYFFPFLLKYPRLVTLVIILDVAILFNDQHCQSHPRVTVH